MTEFDRQSDLFGWEKQDSLSEWTGMPEYLNVYEDGPEITATFKFRCKEDYDRFHEGVKKHLYNGSRVFDGTQLHDKKQAWFPRLDKSSIYEYVDEGDPKSPRFPVYIVSKGRWTEQHNPTSKHLKLMGVPFYMIVEEEEYERYLEICNESQLLVLPQQHKDSYDTFWDDSDPRTGPGPARNYAWEHSIGEGHLWHWVMDDNIAGFERFNRNMKVQCNSGTCFYIVEDFVLRYENVGMAGMNYANFCPATEARPPVRFNTRIYSCNLIRNDIPFRWRGRYNEDTDLSLRILKGGWCTVMFNAFLASKLSTTKIVGGNTEEFYANEGTLNKSQMLVDMHPDVARIGTRWNRWHHYVNYRPFAKNRLIKKEDVQIQEEPNNYGLVLRRKSFSEK